MFEIQTIKTGGTPPLNISYGMLSLGKLLTSDGRDPDPNPDLRDIFSPNPDPDIGIFLCQSRYIYPE